MVVLLVLAWLSSGGSSVEYETVDPAVRQWFRDAMITERAQHRFQHKSCCDHSDVVKTKFVVDHKTNGDVWLWLDQERGIWREVPEDIIHWGEAAPDGRPTLFIYKGLETCFYPGRSLQ